MIFGFGTKEKKKQQILQQLQEFEDFCIGQAHLSPKDFRRLNKELSHSAIMHIGAHKYKKTDDGKHFIWITPDRTEHDLGLANQINIIKEGPGFHKKRTKEMAGKHVVDVDVCRADTNGKSMTMVKMSDGSVGVAPNYNLALRNAALKMHLKQAFETANPETSWLAPYGQC